MLSFFTAQQPPGRSSAKATTAPFSPSLTSPSRPWEKAIVVFLGACALVSVLVTAGIIYVLLSESLEFFSTVPWQQFFFGKEWSPLMDPRSFGSLPLLAGTVLVAVGACVIALPLGLGSAVYLAEYAGARQRAILKPFLELLAGIPSVVFGYFAVVSVTPFLRFFVPDTEVFNALSASIVLGFMIVPVVASLCDDALRAVPQQLRDGGYALGATKKEVVKHILVPAAISGIMASFILAFARAIGETMAVTLAAGATPRLTLNPLVSIQTMTSYIVQVSMGDTPHGTVEYQSLFAIALYLFLLTAAMNLFSYYIVRRYRQVVVN